MQPDSELYSHVLHLDAMFALSMPIHRDSRPSSFHSLSELAKTLPPKYLCSIFRGIIRSAAALTRYYHRPPVLCPDNIHLDFSLMVAVDYLKDFPEPLNDQFDELVAYIPPALRTELCFPSEEVMIAYLVYAISVMFAEIIFDTHLCEGASYNKQLPFDALSRQISELSQKTTHDLMAMMEDNLSADMRRYHTLVDLYQMFQTIEEKLPGVDFQTYAHSHTFQKICGIMSKVIDVCIQLNLDGHPVPYLCSHNIWIQDGLVSLYCYIPYPKFDEYMYLCPEFYEQIDSGVSPAFFPYKYIPYAVSEHLLDWLIRYGGSGLTLDDQRLDACSEFHCDCSFGRPMNRTKADSLGIDIAQTVLTLCPNHSHDEVTTLTEALWDCFSADPERRRSVYELRDVLEKFVSI